MFLVCYYLDLLKLFFKIGLHFIWLESVLKLLYFSEVRPGLELRHSRLLAGLLRTSYLTSLSPSFFTWNYCEEEMKYYVKCPARGLATRSWISEIMSAVGWVWEPRSQDERSEAQASFSELNETRKSLLRVWLWSLWWLSVLYLGKLPAFPSSWSGTSVGSGVLCSSVLCWGDCVFVKLSMRSMSAALPNKDCHWLTQQVQTESTERPSRNKKLPSPFWKAMASIPLGVFVLNWFVIWRKHNT